MVKVVWLCHVHVIAAQLQRCRDNIWTRCCFALLLNSLGLSRPFTTVLPLSFCLVESPLYYHICCFSSYCGGVTSVWTPLRFPKYSEIMHLTNRGYTDINVAFQNQTHDCLEWPKSFIKVVLMSFQDCFWVLVLLVALSHLVCSLMETWPPAEAGQRWSQSPRLKTGRLPVIVVRCRMLNDAHVFNLTGATTFTSCKSS